MALSIDRIAPTRPQRQPTIMWQRWAHLLFLHWEVPVAELRPLVPGELEIDTFEGRAFVGLVPFTMTGVRPRFCPPVRALSDFHETNVRTYVHYRGRDPGLWFLSLDAANGTAVRIARWLWKLGYRWARMGLRQDGDRFEYWSDRIWPGPRPASLRVAYTRHGRPAPAVPGTLDHFLAERYLLYSQEGPRLFIGRVHHAPYPLQSATVHRLEESLVAAAGIRRPDIPPLVHYASEVRTRIHPLLRL